MSRKKSTQLSFDLGPEQAHQTKGRHGGEHSPKGKRKLARPLSVKRPLHVVMRSEKALGKLSLLKQAKAIDAILTGMAARFHVKIYERANAGSHLHLLIRGKTKLGIQNFLRSVTALIARLMTSATRGNPMGKFWDALVFTRLLTWGCEFRGVLSYIQENTLEALGITEYRPRHVSLKAFMGFG